MLGGRGKKHGSLSGGILNEKIETAWSGSIAEGRGETRLYK